MKRRLAVATLIVITLAGLPGCASVTLLNAAMGVSNSLLGGIVGAVAPSVGEWLRATLGLPLPPMT